MQRVVPRYYSAYILKIKFALEFHQLNVNSLQLGKFHEEKIYFLKYLVDKYCKYFPIVNPKTPHY